MDHFFSWPNRQAIRCQGHDYSADGLYFVTMCLQERRHLLGTVRHGCFYRSPVGSMVAYWWQELEQKFPSVILHAWVLMPDHLHGILELKDGLLQSEQGKTVVLPGVIGWLKTMTTNDYFRNVKAMGWPRVRRRLWQRSYHERIIPNQTAYRNITRYIIQNPSNWNTG